MADFNEHVLDSNNPHEVNKTQVGLDQVPNYGLASLSQALEGILTDQLVTPQQLQELIDQFLIEKGIIDENKTVIIPEHLLAEQDYATDWVEGHWMYDAYFEELGSDQLISGNALADAIGLTQGYPQNSDAGWLHFRLNSQSLYVAKRTFRNSISWEDIYQAGAVYGTGDAGAAPSPVDQPVDQNAQVTLNGTTYRVRLLKGANQLTGVDTDGYDLEATKGSEWNRLLYRVHEEVQALQEGDNFANYTQTDLGVHMSSGPGSYSWCQESSSNPEQRIRRGVVGINYINRTSVTNRHNDDGWRPVLEPIN